MLSDPTRHRPCRIHTRPRRWPLSGLGTAALVALAGAVLTVIAGVL